MDYKIVEKKEIKLVGLNEKIVMPNNTIPQLWEKFLSRMGEIKNNSNTGCYGLASNMIPETYEFDELVALEVSSFEDIPEGMITKVIEPQKYLVFTHKGKIFYENGESKMPKTYDYLYGKLLPSTEFQLDKNFNFELYDERFKNNSDESQIDIYIPIK